MPKTSHHPSANTETSPYDVAQHLRTPEEMAAYLDAWLTEAPEDAAGIARALGDIARAKGMLQASRYAGLGLGDVKQEENRVIAQVECAQTAIQ